MVGIRLLVLVTVLLGAETASAKTNAILVAKPQISARDTVTTGILYNAVLEGIQDSLRADAANPRFERMFTERDMGDPTRQIEPLKRFAHFSSTELDSVLGRMFKDAKQYKLTYFLDVAIVEVSPDNYELTLKLYALEPSWNLLTEKHIGGCNESLDELAAQTREAALTIISSGARAGPPPPIINITPKADANTYIIGTRIAVDSCGVQARGGEVFDVLWLSPLLQHRSHRRRLQVQLDREGTFPFTLELTNKHGSTSEKSEIKVVPQPVARPVLSVCNGEQCNDVPTVDVSSAMQKAPFPTGKKTAFSATQQALPDFDEPELEVLGEPQRPTPAANGDVRLVRVTASGTTTVRLEAQGIAPAHRVEWQQLSGTPLTFTKDKPKTELEISATQSGYYVFKVVVSAGQFSEEKQISFLAAPELHADAGGPTILAKVGEPILLDGSASYDVLGETLSYTWVVLGKVRNGSVDEKDKKVLEEARLMDTHSAHPRFVATETGTYRVRLYARVVRKIDEVSVAEIATKEVDIVVESSDWAVFADFYGSSNTTAIGRIGIVWQPAIRSPVSIARSFGLRRLIGVAFGSELVTGTWTDYKGGLTTGADKHGVMEIFAGLAIRSHDRLQLSVTARLFSVERANGDHDLGFGGAADLAQRLGSPLPFFRRCWLRIGFRIGPPPLLSREAHQSLSVQFGIGASVEF